MLPQLWDLSLQFQKENTSLHFTLLFKIFLMLDHKLDQLGAYCDKGYIEI